MIEDHGDTPPKNPSLGQLYGQAAEILGLRAEAMEGDSAASRAAKQVLGGLMGIATGMAGFARVEDVGTVVVRQARLVSGMPS